VHWSAEIQTKVYDPRKVPRSDRTIDQASEFALAHLLLLTYYTHSYFAFLQNSCKKGPINFLWWENDDINYRYIVHGTGKLDFHFQAKLMHDFEQIQCTSKIYFNIKKMILLVEKLWNTSL